VSFATVDRGAAVLSQDGEDVLGKLSCLLLVLAQKSAH
jgi:hypothetical protein